MNINNDIINSSKSWDEYIKTYHKQKTENYTFQPIKKETAYEHKRLEREFNPITQRYLNENKVFF